MFSHKRKRIVIALTLIMLALVFLCAKKAHSQTSEEQKLNKWWTEYQQAPVGSDTRKELLDELDSIQVDFDSWLLRYDDPLVGAELHAKLLKILFASSQTYAQKRALWGRIPAEKDLLHKLLKDLVESATDAGEVLDLCLRVTPGTGFEKKSAKKLERVYIPLEEMVAVYLNSPSNNFFFREGLLKNIREIKTTDFEEWEKANTKTSVGDPLWELTSEKMRETAKTHRHWLKVLREVDEDNHKLWQNTFQECLRTAAYFAEHLANVDEADADSKEWVQSMENALRLARYRREVREVLKRAPPGSDLETRVQEKLKKVEEELEREQQDIPPADNVGSFFNLFKIKTPTLCQSYFLLPAISSPSWPGDGRGHCASA